MAGAPVLLAAAFATGRAGSRAELPRIGGVTALTASSELPGAPQRGARTRPALDGAAGVCRHALPAPARRSTASGARPSHPAASATRTAPHSHLHELATVTDETRSYGRHDRPGCSRGTACRSPLEAAADPGCGAASTTPPPARCSAACRARHGRAAGRRRRGSADPRRRRRRQRMLPAGRQC